MGLASPWGGFAYHEVTLENLTNTFESLALTTGNALNRLSTSLKSLANVVMDNRLALDYLLAEQGGVCEVINKTCCTDVSNSGQIEVDIKKIHEQASWLHCYNQGSDPNAIWSTIKGALPSLTWFPSLLGPVTMIFLLLFGRCLFNLLVKFMSSRLQQFHLKMMAVQGFQPIPPSDFKQEAVPSLGPLDQASRDFYSLTGRVNTPAQP